MGGDVGGVTDSKICALVIDDDALNQKLLSTILRKRGFEVAVADCAESGRAILDRSNVAVVLMDVRLPEMDGLALTRLLRADPAHRSLIIVAVTASAMSTDRDAAMSAGCDAYIAKPFDAAAIVGLLVDLFESRSRRATSTKGLELR